MLRQESQSLMSFESNIPEDWKKLLNPSQIKAIETISGPASNIKSNMTPLMIN